MSAAARLSADRPWASTRSCRARRARTRSALTSAGGLKNGGAKVRPWAAGGSSRGGAGGLHAPDADVAGPAEEVNEDARPGLPVTAGPPGGALHTRAGQEGAPQQPERPAQADAQAIPARPTLAQIGGTPPDQEHEV